MSSVSHTKPKVIIDCDPGIDDAIALVVANHFSEIIGITTVAGNVPLEFTTVNTQSICELLNLDVPIHSGASHAYSKQSVTAEHVHGHTGLGELLLPKPENKIISEYADNYLIDITKQENDLTLIALGPLTNIAHAIEKDPAFVSRIKSITLMGGSAYGLGNATASAEFNIFADPEAASIVFNSGAHIKMIGLNLTRQVQMGIEHAKILSENIGNRVSKSVSTLLYSYQNLISSSTGNITVPMHDPCAVLAVTHPEFFTFEKRNVIVELDGIYTRGMTVVDERKSSPRINCDVGYQADSENLISLIVDAASTKN